MNIPATLLLALATLPGARSFAQTAAPATAADAAAQICAGRLSSEVLVTAALARAREVAALNAFITLDETGALAGAKKADASAARKTCGPLSGVPIVVKDSIHVAGLPSTGGTPALQKFMPRTDAPVVQRLRAAGAIVLGKTNMHELAFGISGYNAAFKTGPEPGVRNAYDPTRSAGGSSSGTGAALGARVVMAGLGTDTGGSVRIPCAFNGCAALRPTPGRYPHPGIVPISHTRDTAGPMALAMADVELLDRVISGASIAQAAALKTVRLGRTPALLANLDADTKQAFDAVLAKLQAAGVTIVDVEMPGLMELNAAVSFPVAIYEAYDDMVAYLKSNRTGLTIQTLVSAIASPDVKGTYEGLVLPRKLPGPDNTLIDARPAYEAAMRTSRPALRKLYRDAFKKQRLDALVFPTVPHVAFAANADSSSVPVFMATIRNTDPGSNAGVPGLQIPIGIGASSHLPVGMELDGPFSSDRRLVAIGLAIENLLGRIAAPPR